MKIAAFALLIPLLGLATPARAEEPDNDETSLTAAEQLQLRRIFGYDVVPYDNGLDDLIAAADAINLDTLVPAYSSMKPERTDTEKEEARRVALEDNANSLKLARRGLKRGIARRVFDYASPDIMLNSRLRMLTRLFQVEADWHAQAGRLDAALQSNLDSMEIGIAATNGGCWSAFLGLGSQSAERSAISKLAPRLDAPTLHFGARRIREIERRRPSVLQILRSEKSAGLTELIRIWPEISEQDLARNLKISPAEAHSLKRLTTPEIVAQASTHYDEIMFRTRWLFAKRAREPLKPANALLEYFPYIPLKIEQTYRTQIARNLLLAHALELRALKLETGAYPETFASAPDPFGDDSTFIYRRDGENYALYSVAQNGVDDGATPIAKGERGELLAVGDIIAPEL